MWNAEKAILEVENYIDAITLSAQTALRESIGRHELAQMITERETLGTRVAAHSGRENESVGDHGAVGGGARCADSAGAAGRDVAAGTGGARTAGARHSGQAETEISEQFCGGRRSVQHESRALHLRAMNMLYEAIKESGSMVIVPSSAVETMGLGGSLATASLAKQGL